MVKLIEPALKIVTINKRKWLLRLNQKVSEMGTAPESCAFVTQTSPGQEQAPNPTYFSKWNVETPYRSPRDSGSQGPPMAVREQERGQSERRSVMERIGVETSSHAKAGPLPHGLSSRENL